MILDKNALTVKRICSPTGFDPLSSRFVRFWQQFLNKVPLMYPYCGPLLLGSLLPTVTGILDVASSLHM